MRERAATLAMAGAAMVLMGGCGSNDAPIEPVTAETTSSTAASLSQDEFIVSADARCGEANAAIANLTSDGTTAVSQELEITQGLLDGLQGIGTSEDPDGSLQDFYAALEEEIRILGDLESALAGADTGTSSSLDTDLEVARSAAEAAGQQFGFEECGQQGTALSPDATSIGTAAPAEAAPVAPPVAEAPVAPAEPAPVTPEAPPPPTGGAAGGSVAPAPDEGASGGSSGGISPG